MKRIPRTAVLLIVVSLVSIGHYFLSTEIGIPPSVPHQVFREIAGVIKKGETLSEIFKKYSLNIGELDEMCRACADVYRLKALNPGRSYRIVLDDAERIVSFVYGIDDDSFLNDPPNEFGIPRRKGPHQL